MEDSAQFSASIVQLAPGVSVRAGDLNYHFARSGGPGGQNVNKVNTKAELRVKPEALMGMPASALQRLKFSQANRMTVDGDLMIVADTKRSQFANRQVCIERLSAFVQEALVEPKLRKKSRPTKASRERRIEGKKMRSRVKEQRRRNDFD